jgi:hypothetical protein
LPDFVPVGGGRGPGAWEEEGKGGEEATEGGRERGATTGWITDTGEITNYRGPGVLFCVTFVPDPSLPKYVFFRRGKRDWRGIAKAERRKKDFLD